MKIFMNGNLFPCIISKKYLGKEFKFHSNVKILNNITESFSLSYKENFGYWGKYYPQA